MMDERTDFIVLIFRFVFGIVIGSILALWFVLWLSVPLDIAGLFIFTVGICATVWGDKFIMWFSQIFKIFRHM